MEFKDCKVGMTITMNQLSNGKYDITNQRSNCVGKIVHIDYINSLVYIKIIGHDYPLHLDHIFRVNPKCFDCIDDCEQVNFQVLKDKNIIKICYNNKELATAKCSPTDKFDEEFGIALALTRALKKMKNTHEVITVESINDCI